LHGATCVARRRDAACRLALVSARECVSSAATLDEQLGVRNNNKSQSQPISTRSVSCYEIFNFTK